MGRDANVRFTDAGVNAYATAVLLGPYRRGESWAWLLTWLEVAAFASVLLLPGGGGIGFGYFVRAAIAALAQLTALPSCRVHLAGQRMSAGKAA